MIPPALPKVGHLGLQGVFHELEQYALKMADIEVSNHEGLHWVNVKHESPPPPKKKHKEEDHKITDHTPSLEARYLDEPPQGMGDYKDVQLLQDVSHGMPGVMVPREDFAILGVRDFGEGHPCCEGPGEEAVR